MDRPALPPALAGDERFAALTDIVWDLYGELDLEKILVYLIDIAPDAVLPHLADQLSMTDELSWPMAVTPEMQRRVIKSSIELHRYKGTPWAIKRALGEIGYPVVHIIEYDDYITEWRVAGGLFLDGTWSLDGSQTFAPPEALSSDFRIMQLSSWVDYAIRVSVEGAWTREQQRAISRIAATYAPARSRLRAIITSLMLEFDAPIRLVSVRQRGRIRFDNCQRAPVHRWRTLDGCWSLSGDYEPLVLDGAWQLDGALALSGQRPVGPALDSGFATISTRQHARFSISAAGGDRVLAPRVLLPAMPLDGSWRLDGQKLDGSWSLDGSIALDYPTFETLGVRRLDGTWTLGLVPGQAGIWCSAVGTLRRGGVAYREVL
ncbi:phage tail protein [Alcaligenaceae bacterium]|nr:phage tail protein [Alcaligenaceae bacterium]